MKAKIVRDDKNRIVAYATIGNIENGKELVNVSNKEGETKSKENSITNFFVELCLDVVKKLMP